MITSDLNAQTGLCEHRLGELNGGELTLKSSEAKEVLLHLVCWADIVVINFPPRDSLGLPYDALSARELIFIHLADARREVAVLDAPGATDMAVDWNIVWRISTDQVDDFITQKRRIGASFARITANESVPAEHPKVPWLGNSGPLVPIGRYIVLDRGIRAIRCTLPRLVQNDVNFG